jgi:ABC-type sugar transport system ATPase subunit
MQTQADSGHRLAELGPVDSLDLELNRIQTAHLINDVVHYFSWKDLTVKVKDRKTKEPLSILDNAHGIVQAGELLAIMGPSGSGKTTLLNAIAHRKAAAGATATGEILANGQEMSLQKIRQISSYVEQEDALIGSLTVRETVNFAAGLALSRYDLHPPFVFMAFHSDPSISIATFLRKRERTERTI